MPKKRSIPPPPPNPYENMATELYGKRVEDDTRKGQLDIHTRNPNARALYYKGVHDALVCVRIWTNEVRSTETLADMLSALETQTKNFSSH